MEAAEEPLLVAAGHFVGDAWVAVVCSDDAVVLWVEGELDGLMGVSNVLLFEVG